LISVGCIYHEPCLKMHIGVIFLLHLWKRLRVSASYCRVNVIQSILYIFKVELRTLVKSCKLLLICALH